jgi:hypothetical protein
MPNWVTPKRTGCAAISDILYGAVLGVGMPDSISRRLRWVWGAAGGALWATAVAGGVVLLWRYASTPGLTATPPSSWPAESTIVRAPDRATVVMLAHPHCPCTRASMTELAVLMSRLRDRAVAHVLFLLPKGAATDWEKTELWRRAAAIPGVTVHSDVAGVEAARFHAATSGQTVVYDGAGQLLFRGGITGARGHEGDNAGVERIVSLVGSGTADRAESSVFGCPLQDPLAGAALMNPGEP